MAQDPDTVVQTSEQLWSEAVARADAGEIEEFPAYEWSNGRKTVMPDTVA